MNITFSPRSPRVRRFLSRGIAVTAAAILAASSLGPVTVAAPVSNAGVAIAQHQNVDWMSSESASYLGSIGMQVMVPSWVPSPFTGVAPDVYAGGGSYSLYWMTPGAPPTFLHITGVVGGALPDGSKADLNIPLSINTDVQGWPAIRDIGVPAGSSTQIYDQVWWIANGVRYSVESNNIGTDSLTIANSMVLLTAPAPAEPTVPPVVVPPTAPPVVVPPTAPPVVETPVWQEPVAENPTAQPPVSTSPGPDTPAPTSAPVTGSSIAPSVETGASGGGSTQTATSASGDGTSAGSGDDATDGAWSPDQMDAGFLSDGTAGPRPPVIGGDGTGGLYDTSLPRIINYRP